MIQTNKLTEEYIAFIQNRFAGTIFGFAPWYGIWFDKKEIKYIETKMETDKLYQLIADTKTKRSPHNRIFEFRRTWLNAFLQDTSLPIGLRAFIHYYVARENGMMKINDEVDGTNKYKDSIDYELTAQRWMEKCR